MLLDISCQGGGGDSGHASAQRLQNPLVKECTLNLIKAPIVIVIVIMAKIIVIVIIILKIIRYIP